MNLAYPPTKFVKIFALNLILLVVFAQEVPAQFSGSRGGVTETSKDSTLPVLNPQAAQTLIVVEGKSVLAVEPTSIRVVLALTSEATDAGACKNFIEKKINLLRPAWNQAGIANKQIVEDFISDDPAI